MESSKVCSEECALWVQKPNGSNHLLRITKKLRRSH